MRFRAYYVTPVLKFLKRVRAGKPWSIVQRLPDLVILDVNLPDISGFAVCKQIKANETTARIPVLHLSATMVSTDARVAGLDGGADGYLVQPVEPEELVATVRALLRVRKAEEALWKSEQQYRLFFEANPLACWVFSTADLRILAVNEAAVKQYGYSREEFMRLTLRDIVSDKELLAADELIRTRALLGQHTEAQNKKWRSAGRGGSLGAAAPQRQ